MMHEIYSHSFLNLAATHQVQASAGSSSLFHHRSRPSSWYMWTKTKRGERLLVHDNNFWKQEVEDINLNQRGWVLQERMLTPRMVYFGSSQLFWECEELQACERFPNRIPPYMAPPLGKPLDPQEFGKRWFKRSRDEPRRTWGQKTSRVPTDTGLTHELWFRLVERYSHCQITNPGDKLIAISGLSKRLASVLKTPYIAGMWRSRLLESLAWTRYDDTPTLRPTPTASTYLAPSWSWASCQHSIKFPEIIDLEDSAQIIDVSVAPMPGQDDFGALQSASLCVRGDLFGNLRIKNNSRARLWR